ncbi:hypothetical protein GBA52_017049 [Prunus armeniaca]|nr:hypothetical protein GBA52_017049 [Prunus armeniaca]
MEMVTGEVGICTTCHLRYCAGTRAIKAAVGLPNLKHDHVRFLHPWGIFDKREAIHCTSCSLEQSSSSS